MPDTLGIVVIIAIVGSLMIYTLFRIRRSKLGEAEKGLWQLLVVAMPGIGLLLWYAYERGRGRRK